MLNGRDCSVIQARAPGNSKRKSGTSRSAPPVSSRPALQATRACRSRGMPGIAACPRSTGAATQYLHAVAHTAIL
eukprot:scaffold79231_cov77-Phaeocystis_antarctica.AAC.1